MRIAVVQPRSHSVNASRAVLLSECLKFGNTMQLINLFEKGNGKNLMLGNLKQLRALVAGRYDAIYFIGITWVTPQLLRLLTLGRPVIVYDAANVEVGVAQTLSKSRIMILIVSLLEALFVRGSDIVVVRGVTFQSYFRRRFKGLAAAFFYVPDSIDIMGQKHDESPANVQSLKVAYVSTYVFIDVNGDSVPRGWELVDAVAMLRGRFRVEVRVDFLGSGVAVEALKARAVSAGVADLCTFSGYLPRELMLKRLRMSEVGFMEDYDTLGYRYSIGSKVQEYMSLGLPVITGYSPEKLHLLKNQRLPNLLFRPPALNTSKSVEEYTESLVRALHYATLNRNALVFAGYRNLETAKQTFEWNVVSSMMDGVFRAVKQELSAKRGQLLDEKPDAVV